MVSWQRRSSLGRRRVVGVTALGRSSLFSFPLLAGRPLFLLVRRRSWAVRTGAMPNFAFTEFSEMQQEEDLKYHSFGGCACYLMLATVVALFNAAGLTSPAPLWKADGRSERPNKVVCVLRRCYRGHCRALF